jgi:NAD-dependent SIR2 family protein deacetylase
MQKINQYVQELSRASNNGNLVFFVGAGVSTISEYPQWWELVNRFHSSLYGNPKEGNYSSDEFLRIPQIYYDVEGEKAYDTILEDIFKVEKPTNPVHDKILALNPVHIITTNYDELIDKACSQRGRYFSVISAEEDVAKATSPRYLLKVHGDFRRGYKGKNVVLKESDYMNYEQNYPLISNLMKTIMATHTIVFIGYGLGDYNINSLLNWVRQLQKDGYNKPFFVRVDPEPIEEKISKYYESKGLRIIDAASITNSSKNEYIKRYDNVLNLLIDTKNNTPRLNDDDVLEYIHQKICPLFVLRHVRKLDLKHVFDNDYHFEVNGIVVRVKNKGFGYMERFFELKKMDEANISECSQKKFDEISTFMDQNGIIGMIDKVEKLNLSFNIESPAYHFDFNEMERIVQSQPKVIEEQYYKAFFLAYLGRWENAYNLYTDLLLKSIKESKWWIHYLSQINRFRLYQAITYTSNFRDFSEGFLERVEREMKNFNIDNVYGGMPYEFQEKYKILEFLSDNKFLYDDTVKLFELTNKIRSEISKGSYSFGNLTADMDVQLRLYENLRFLYDNGLWSVSFKEFKQYIRNSLILQFEKAEYDQTRDIDEFGQAIGSGLSGFYIDYYDFVNVVKFFKIDDVKHIERSCKIERFKIHDTYKIEQYLTRISDGIVKYGAKEDFAFFKQIIDEAEVAFYFAKYVKLSEVTLIKIIRTLLFHFPERDVGRRYLWIDRLTNKNGLPKGAMVVIEEFLFSQANRHAESNFSELSSNNFFSKNFCNLIIHFDREFVSNKLSEYVLELNENMGNQINYMYGLASILSNEAKEHLFNLKNIGNVRDLMDSLRAGVIKIENISEYMDIIINYMHTWKEERISDRKNGIIKGYANNYALQFGIQYFLGGLRDLEMKEYMGVDDEFDMFVNPETFDFEKFRPSWLKTYGERLLIKIAENNQMRNHIIEILKERITNTKDKRYLEIFLKYFI